MSGLTWAIALAMLSAIGYAAAAVAQEHYAGTTHGVRRWAVPLLLTGVGAGLHVAALRYGAVGVVQALGALTLIFALPIAAVRGRRRVTGAAWHHAWLTVGGLAGLLTLTTGGTAALPANTALWLAAAAAAAITALAVTAHRATTAPAVRSLLLSGAAGAGFGVASVLTKTLMTGTAAGALSGTSALTAVAIAGLSAAGQVLSQHSYRGAGLAAPLAMVSVVNPAIAGATGLLLIGDGIRFGGTGAALATVAAVITARGVIGLATHSSPAHDASATAATTSVPGGGAPVTVTTLASHRRPDTARVGVPPHHARAQPLARQLTAVSA
jgi:hypothetical protein